ncbi:unnamed protein product [Cuscuta campestris]|uniref:Uncharacterized protein n=1 Tax=Cuscuta campestris TaxID=132261 RepID=A0A484L9M1_9ASTE|nr:unnamed protein product [Cuscuta campestris]
MANSYMGPWADGRMDKEACRSQQIGNGKALEEPVARKQTSHKDMDEAGRRHEPPKEGQEESESHVSVLSRMRVPAKDWLHGRRNTIARDWEGKVRMPYEEQYGRHRDAQPERCIPQAEQPIHDLLFKLPHGAPERADGDGGTP